MIKIYSYIISVWVRKFQILISFLLVQKLFFQFQLLDSFMVWRNLRLSLFLMRFRLPNFLLCPFFFFLTIATRTHSLILASTCSRFFLSPFLSASISRLPFPPPNHSMQHRETMSEFPCNHPSLVVYLHCLCLSLFGPSLFYLLLSAWFASHFHLFFLILTEAACFHFIVQISLTILTYIFVFNQLAVGIS